MFSAWNAKLPAIDLKPELIIYETDVMHRRRAKVWFAVITYSSELYLWCLNEFAWLKLPVLDTHTMPVCTEHCFFWGSCAHTAWTRVPWYIPYLFHYEKKPFRHISITLKSVLDHFKSGDPVNARSTSAAQSCPCRHILRCLWQVHGKEKKKSQKGEEIHISINHY